MNRSHRILDKLNKVAMTLENMNLFQEANEIHKVFVKFAADYTPLTYSESPSQTYNLPGPPDQLNIEIERDPNATYPQVINEIKQLIVSGQKDKEYEEYSWQYNNNIALNPAQKQALGVQYKSILDRFKGTSKSQIANNLATDLDKTANTLVAQYIKKLGFDKAQITLGSNSYKSVRSMISKIRDLNLRYTAIEILDSIVNMNSQSERVK